MNDNIIEVTCLAKKLGLHIKTLKGWLCHYTLWQYVEILGSENHKPIQVYRLNENSINALREYLSKKRKKYLSCFDKTLPAYIRDQKFGNKN